MTILYRRNLDLKLTGIALLTLLLSVALGLNMALADDHGDEPQQVGTEIWVNGQDTDQIFVLDGLDLVDTIGLPAGSGPHMTMFSSDGSHAYVAAINSGDVIILDAETRQTVATLDFGDKGVHQAAPSPDGSLVVVAQQDTSELIRVAADEPAGNWVETGRLGLADKPVCTIFVPGTSTAYVSLAAEDLAVVDLASMTVTGMVDLAGQARCNFTWSNDGSLVYLTAENGTDSFLYALDPATGAADLLHTFAGVKDLHTPAFSPDGKVLYIIGRANDTFYTVDLADMSMTSFEIGSPGVADQPDGMVIEGNNAYINLKATGKLARVQIRQARADYVDLVAPSKNALTNIMRRPSRDGGGCRSFAETGRSVCGPFLNFWSAHGGVMIFGFPLTDAYVNESGLTVQYFERARFEHHPENAGTAWEMLLGRLGAEIVALEGSR